MSEWVSTFPGYLLLVTRLKRVVVQICRTGPVPLHIGLIMDGNRRFAKNRHIELKEGHNMGFDSMAAVLELLYDSGVSCATVYAFSIENFKRLKTEVDWLMELAKSKLMQMSQHGELCDKYGIRVRILGNFSFVRPDVVAVLNDIMHTTRNNTRAVLNVCFPYTSRDEMTSAVRRVAQAVNEDPLLVADEDLLSSFMYTADSPPLDLLIRTSGTRRLSDFLLWQCVPSLCTIVFSEKLWPEFSPWDMTEILLTWSFNKYWYGHGSGQPVLHAVESRGATWKPDWDELSPVPSNTSTAFKRFGLSSTLSGDETLPPATAHSR
ncbi:Di-trans-poly-cis-decaprenylcistransferase [Metschnikowia bicuspidata]|uniref:Alkyl transferase n=1 Tax=Metschnikowia bicuspidata TaxID=27322 RepID=A0A4P9Z9R1_9ASCO|nr:Di-trans-poly-cis-decaprenylcistransferase [Metschnikowia bicuspidata]